MRFTGIRLLLVFVITNTVMILLLVPSVTSRHPWLAHFLPGQFEPGSNYTGYWVFFALVVLVDAITVLAVAMGIILPAMREMIRADPDLVSAPLAGRQGVSEAARDAILEEMRDQLVTARTQLFVGRVLLGIGAFFLILAFASVTLSFARAIPAGSMFVQECTAEVPVCGQPVFNAAVSRAEIHEFTLDQITRGVLLGAPDVYGWRFSSFGGNPRNVLFSHFIFAFRLLLGLVLVVVLVSLRMPAAARLEDPAPKAAPLQERHEISA